MNRICHMIAGGLAAAFLAAPAFGQQRPMPMNDCTKITAAGQAGCKADNDLRTECNKTSNPIQCYNTKKAAASKPAPTTPAPVAKPAAPAPAATRPIPAGAKACGTDGQTCNASGAWKGIYGVAGKNVDISGTGPFVCSPAGLKVADPAQGVQKMCYLTSGTIAVAAPKAAPKPAVAALPLTCKGGLVNNVTRKFTSMGDFSKNYQWGENMKATSLEAATSECRESCAKTGEPAPCGWYTLVQWRNDSSASGKSTGSFSCYKVNSRNYKDAFKPVMAKDQNFGNAANGLFYRDAWTYPCAR